MASEKSLKLFIHYKYPKTKTNLNMISSLIVSIVFMSLTVVHLPRVKR